MAVKVHSQSKAKASRNGMLKKHVAHPATFRSVLKTYGLTPSGFAKVKRYVEKRLGHALAS
jgi:hypothetical protein